MDFKNLVEKAKAALGKNPAVIDKAGDFVDKKTGGKYSSHVDKAQDAAKKFSGGQQAGGQQNQQGGGQQNVDPQGPPQQ
ncbi:antitoxin [Tsukamurella sp. 1534]|uniref:antitoxin n=1 Tax=Tsukamurella sp. 1534 TaxID=1151061 RepID=UPI0002DD8271|nr:antitoxin [Tsukamurella sp. 1534]